MSAPPFRVSWALIGAALLVAVLGYAELRLIGFPDGYRSDADLARAMLLRGLIGVSALVGAMSLAVSRHSAPGSAGRRQRILAMTYAAMLLAALAGNLYLLGLSGRGG